VGRQELRLGIPCACAERGNTGHLFMFDAVLEDDSRVDSEWSVCIPSPRQLSKERDLDQESPGNRAVLEEIYAEGSTHLECSSKTMKQSGAVSSTTWPHTKAAF